MKPSNKPNAMQNSASSIHCLARRTPLKRFYYLPYLVTNDKPVRFIDGEASPWNGIKKQLIQLIKRQH